MRWLVSFAVRRWQITAVFCIFLAVLGIQSLLTIPRSVDPHFPTPFVITTVVLPGADARKMEETVAKPLEDALQGLDHIREVRSRSTDGVAVIVCEFDDGTDDEEAQVRVERIIGAQRSTLPQGIDRIEYRLPRTTEAAVLQIALVSEGANWRRMTKYADDLVKQLSVLKGVRSVTPDGLAPVEIRLTVDSKVLAETRTPLSTVASAVQQAGSDVAAGSVQLGERKLNVDSGGEFRSLEQLATIPVKTANGQLLRLDGIAQVGWSEGERRHVTRYNGMRAIFVSVRQKQGSDATQIRNEVAATLEQFEATLPPDIQIKVAFDQSNDISEKLAHLGRDFLIALLLVLVTLSPLGLRASLIVLLSIPLSLAMGIILLSIGGFSLNQISVAGFIIALGLLVDDSIVVTENIERHMREGQDPTDAAIGAPTEVGRSVVGATTVLVLAFLPLAFMPETSGDFIRGLPVAVVATVASSLLVSITVIPFLASKVLQPRMQHTARILNFILETIQRLYSPLLTRALDRPKRWVWGAMAICCGAVAVVPVIGFSLFPAADAPYLLVQVETPEGSNIDATDRVVEQVSAIIAREPIVRDRMDNVGASNPQIYYNALPHNQATNYGEIFVTLKAWDVAEGPAMIDRLRSKFAQVSNARVTVIRLQNGPPVEAPIAVRISGPDLTKLGLIAKNVAAELNRVDGLRDISNPLAMDRLGLDLGISDERAGLLGVSSGEMKRVVRLMLSGEVVGYLLDEEGDRWPVVLRSTDKAKPPLEALDEVYLVSRFGTPVPLAQIADPQIESVPPEITRRQLERSTTVTAQSQPGYLNSDLTREVKSRLAQMPLPAGYRLSYGGEDQSARRSFSGLGVTVGVALFGIFATLVVLFGRFRETLVALGVVPLGMLGGLAMLLLTGNSLSFLAAIGFIALIGIEMKNSILLIDYAVKLRESGLPVRDAVVRAAEVRFLPVLLTSATAIGGLLPLALGGTALYSPLAWVIIGGLISSTLLSRLVTPTMYYLFCR